MATKYVSSPLGPNNTKRSYRTCLRCLKKFKSRGAGNRICTKCKCDYDYSEAYHFASRAETMLGKTQAIPRGTTIADDLLDDIDPCWT